MFAIPPHTCISKHHAHCSACAPRATTHSDLQLRAIELGIPVKVIHNASIINAIGAVGLQLYRFGEVGCLGRAKHCTCLAYVSATTNNAAQPNLSHAQTVSLVFFTETWRPDSFYDKILVNRKQGLHTLCLLDIKAR